MITKAKTSVSGFRLREGNDIGCKVTLRGRRMYEFLDRLISIALPRIRDFRGVNPNSFDGHGNYSLGLAEQVVFPEIDADRIQHTHGHGHHHRDLGRRTTTRPASCCASSACRSASRPSQGDVNAQRRDPSRGVRAASRPNRVGTGDPIVFSSGG